MEYFITDSGNMHNYAESKRYKEVPLYSRSYSFLLEKNQSILQDIKVFLEWIMQENEIITSITLLMALL